jgi:hypothetical protein
MLLHHFGYSIVKASNTQTKNKVNKPTRKNVQIVRYGSMASPTRRKMPRRVQARHRVRIKQEARLRIKTVARYRLQDTRRRRLLFTFMCCFHYCSKRSFWACLSACNDYGVVRMFAKGCLRKTVLLPGYLVRVRHVALSATRSHMYVYQSTHAHINAIKRTSSVHVHVHTKNTCINLAGIHKYATSVLIGIRPRQQLPDSQYNHSRCVCRVWHNAIREVVWWQGRSHVSGVLRKGPAWWQPGCGPTRYLATVIIVFTRLPILTPNPV